MQIIAHLDRNATAYDKIMKEETILTHGNETIEKYLSFGDNVGSGKLKERIRNFWEWIDLTLWAKPIMRDIMVLPKQQQLGVAG